jgi:hypothetical protein
MLVHFLFSEKGYMRQRLSTESLAALRRDNLRAVLPALTGVLAIGIAALGGAVVLYFTAGIRPSHLVNDATMVLHAPFYIAALHNAGVLLWFTAGAIACFTVWVLPDGPQAGRSRPLLRALGLFTIVLAIDDLYLFHEVVAPQYLGVPELAVQLLYVVWGSCLAIHQRRMLLGHPEGSVLFCGVALLGMSLLIDASGVGEGVPGGATTEDGLKWLGILCWLLFCVQASRREVQAVLRSTGSSHHLYTPLGQKAPSSLGSQ